jgi:hypothetical protein
VHSECDILVDTLVWGILVVALLPSDPSSLSYRHRIVSMGEEKREERREGMLRCKGLPFTEHLK